MDDVQELKQELESNKAKAVDLEKKLRLAEFRVKRAQQDLTAQQEAKDIKIKELEENLFRSQEIQAEFQNKAQKSEEDMVKMQQERLAENQQIKILKLQIERLKEELSKKEQNTNSNTEEKLQFQQQIQKQEDDNKNLKQEIQTLKSEVVKKNEELILLQQQINENQMKLQQSDLKVVNLSAQIKGLLQKGQNDEISNFNKQLEDQQKTYEDKIQSIQDQHSKELADTHKKLLEIQVIITGQMQELALLSEEKEKYKQKQEQTQEQLETLIQRNHILENQYQEMESQMDLCKIPLKQRTETVVLNEVYSLQKEVASTHSNERQLIIEKETLQSQLSKIKADFLVKEKQLQSDYEAMKAEMEHAIQERQYADQVAASATLKLAQVSAEKDENYLMYRKVLKQLSEIKK